MIRVCLTDRFLPRRALELVRHNTRLTGVHISSSVKKRDILLSRSRRVYGVVEESIQGERRVGYFVRSQGYGVRGQGREGDEEAGAPHAGKWFEHDFFRSMQVAFAPTRQTHRPHRCPE